MKKNDFTLSFIVGPKRKNEFYNAWSSLQELDPYPSKVMIFFNPFSYDDHDIFFDMADIRHTCEIFKFKTFHSISQCWNLSILLGNSKYTIICNDDIVFTQENLLKQIRKKHEEEKYELVHCAEAACCFSIDDNLIRRIGWYDENFPHSFEDVDWRFRMNRANVEHLVYKFEPHLVKHLRSPSGRRDDFWDKSSEYFFKKWGIEEHLKLVENLNAKQRRILQSQGFLRSVDPKKLTQKIETPKYYEIS